MVDIISVVSGLWRTSSLSVGRSDLTATSIGSVSIFAGGFTGVASSRVDIFDSVGVWTTLSLSVARYGLTGYHCL